MKNHYNQHAYRQERKSYIRSQFHYAQRKKQIIPPPPMNRVLPLHHFSTDPFAPALAATGALKVFVQPS